MKIRTLSAAVILAAASAAASAADTSLLIYGGSHHFTSNLRHETQYKLNETNPGIGLEVSQDGWLVGAGTYKDSFYQQAYMAYAGYRWTIGDAKAWHANVALKAGYLNGSGHHGPALLPTVGVGYGPVSLEATAFPSKVRNGGVLAFWLRTTF